MTNQEILIKAIEKAIAGRWITNIGVKDGDIYYRSPGMPYTNKELHPNDYIFNHDFAKALWGELPKRSADMYDCPRDEIGQIDTENWEHHLQQMVIANDPIAYLGENL